MICYKDKTFCIAFDCVKYEGCSDGYTDDIQREAEAISLPVMVSDRRACYERKRPVQEASKSIDQ